MVRPELGSKRTCVQCGARFYDLGRQPAVCPKCGTEQPPEQPRLRRPPPQAPDERKALAVPPELEAVDLDVEGVDTPVLEDADVLKGEDEPLESDIDVETEGDDEAEP
jgi:uncharacterized protein (TIGR02300 family)